MKNIGLFLALREKIPNNFKSKIFLIINLGKTATPKLTHKPTPNLIVLIDIPKTTKAQTRKSKHKISPLK